MKVEIRRHGIVIKSVKLTGDRARIGSAEECEIQLNDRFLSPVVAELTKSAEGWRIVDSGTSLEGVQRDGGARVLDEPVVPGTTYIVGAFEVQVGEGGGATRPTISTIPGQAPDDYIPSTMMESGLGAIPMTVVEPVPLPRQGSGGAIPPTKKLSFTPVGSANPPDPHPPVRRPASASGSGAPVLRRILLVSLVVIAAAVLGLIVITSGSSKKPKAVAKAGAVKDAGTPVPPQKAGELRGDEYAARLEVRKAVEAWEREIARGGNEALRQRVSHGAFEVGRAYSAAGDDANAAFYFEKVVKYGSPDSAEVRMAKQRLQALGGPASL